MTVSSSFITRDPKVMGGRPCIRGLRITVAMLLNLIANGMTPEQITAEYPDLTIDDYRDALLYAAKLADDHRVVG